MIKYVNLFMLLLVTAVFAGDQSILPVDDHRGPWRDTIDEDARPYAYKRVTDITFKGPTALRFELRDGDCYTAYPNNPSQGWDDCTRDRERAEVREVWQAPLDKPVWYQIHLYIPEDYEPMYPKQIFWQWHNGLWGPNLYLHLNENKFHVDILTISRLTTTQYTFGRDVLNPGRWHEITVNAVWSANKDRGRIVIYVDGRRLVQYHGPTVDEDTYKSGKGPFVKFGIYRSHLFRWKQNRPHPTHVLYFDEYRRGFSFREVDANNYPGD